jgi:hypothetical protein
MAENRWVPQTMLRPYVSKAFLLPASVLVRFVGTTQIIIFSREFQRYDKMHSPELPRYANVKWHLPRLMLLAFASLWVLPAVAAPKTDIVMFKNGDQITGEIITMKRGRLSLNTDAVGTISIEWDKISGLTSDQHIQLETISGIRYFGSLKSAEGSRSIIVVTDNGPQALDPDRVIVMSPIEGVGIHALDVDLSLGYNFTKAGGIESGNFGVNMDYRSLIRIESLRFITTLSDSDTQEPSKRMNLTLQHTRLWNNRWFSNGTLMFDQNDELGLNLRTSLGGGFGRYLVQSNTMLWSLEAGLQVSREDLIENPDDTDSVEATFGLQWDWFLFQDPELDWSTAVSVIPSLTESGRVRSEIETSLQWELIGDLNWAISLFGSFDNQPQSATGSTSDYSINTTVVYDF